MANTIDSLTLEESASHIKQRYLVLSDGTGMSDVVMLDKSALTVGPSGVEPVALDLIELEAQAWGSVNSILLEWDHTTDDEIFAFGTGAVVRWCKEWGPLKDPRTAGATGDVVITSNGLSANAGFQITSTWAKRTDK